ncbi:App1 family protein [Adhaeribacter aquaticus]|uniref:App1 family protein n=1 Tax=Adhaeribacter aquaticus TaxID=299567 RepID=UPI00041791BD|nr:phosphatase domain-containing protein [Adhaeribacter aquaticus]
MDLKKAFTTYAAQIEEKIDTVIFDLRRRLNLFQPLQIVPYRSYGTPERLYIKGRVLADKGLTPASDKDKLLHNLLNMYRRFESDEIPNARIKIYLQDEEYETTTDHEGYFTINLEPKTALQLDEIWHFVVVELVDAPLEIPKGLQARAEILVPPPDAEYGIISDIDDTIVKTSATDLLAMSGQVFLKNAFTRLPFAGVSAFYKSLQLGCNGKRNNPFFYVSSSPWNLYDLLHDFLDINEIPPGPLLLRDFGLEGNKLFTSDHMGHKFKEIENILITYPQLNFVLIGDSGQEDPVIYQEVVKKYPTRILAIYIRDVQLPEREKIVIQVSEELKGHKVEMVLIDNTVEAAEHAAKNGLIFAEEIPAIEAEKEKDKSPEPDTLP